MPKGKRRTDRFESNRGHFDLSDRFASYRVSDILNWLGVERWSEGRGPIWPPDAFATAGMILYKADAYASVLQHWPPKRQSRISWGKQINAIGRAWRRAAVSLGLPPKAVRQWWGVITREAHTPIEKVRLNPTLCEALLQICCAADVACEGAGIIQSAGETLDPFLQLCAQFLGSDHASGSTLCLEVNSSVVGVLPKLHTPQSGMTLRSLTHHLALVARSDVSPRWNRWWGWSSHVARRLNLLLLPWPMRVMPQNFAESRGALRHMPDRYGFFTTADLPTIENSEVERTVNAAKKIVDGLDCVVFPELALGMNQAGELSNLLDLAIIGGCGTPATKSVSGTNQAVISFPLPAPGTSVLLRQDKHHRWKLDPSQVRQYALGGRLRGHAEWWEDVRVAKRGVAFHSIESWLTLSVLVCEDLARQDPVAEIVRSVGPDLVVALLMDGPQLGRRWPARYAAVLADDPGSSVLTLTSLGMTQLSCATGFPESRVVAMWKEADSEVKELSLFQGAVGLVLSLRADEREEFTADGRSDERASTHLVLEQVHQVYPPTESTIATAGW